jgi:hypothetical protein
MTSLSHSLHVSSHLSGYLPLILYLGMDFQTPVTKSLDRVMLIELDRLHLQRAQTVSFQVLILIRRADSYPH